MILIAIIEVILVAMLAVCIGWIYNTGEADERRDREIRALGVRMSDVERNIERAQSSIGTAYQNMAEITKEIDGLDGKMEKATETMKQATEELNAVVELVKANEP